MLPDAFSSLESHVASYRRLRRVVFILCCLVSFLGLVLIYIGLSGLYSDARAQEVEPDLGRVVCHLVSAGLMRGKTFSTELQEEREADALGDPPTYWAGRPGAHPDACPPGQYGHDYVCPMDGQGNRIELNTGSSAETPGDTVLTHEGER